MRQSLITVFMCLTYIIAQGQDLVFNYPFNGNTNDESGNGHDAINYGATLTNDRFGNPNSAYYFDGQDHFMEIEPIAELSDVGDFTISLWVKADQFHTKYDGYQDRQMIFSGHNQSKSCAEEDIMKPGPVMVYLYNDSTKKNNLFGGLVYEVNNNSNITYTENTYEYDLQDEWHHLIYGRRGEYIFYYLDSKKITEYKHYSQAINMNHYLFLGDFAGNNQNYFFKGYSFWGNIDDVSFYKKALSENEINTLYKGTESQITINYKTINESNNNEYDGEIDIEISGAILPYTINWSNNKTSEDIFGLTSGIYTVNIVDKMGVSFSKDIEIITSNNTNTCSISGSCFYKNSLEANTTIYLYKKEEELHLISSATTNTRGEFFFQQLPQGEYVLYAYPETSKLSKMRATYFHSTDNKKEYTSIHLEEKLSHVYIKLKENFTPINSFGEASIIMSLKDEMHWISPLTCVTLYSNRTPIMSSAVESESIIFDNLPYGEYTIQFEHPSYERFAKTINLTNKISNIALSANNHALTESTAVKVYPNPSLDFITVTSSSTISKIEIINSQGISIVTFFEINNESFYINTKSYKPGFYKIIINDNYNTTLIKL